MPAAQHARKDDFAQDLKILADAAQAAGALALPFFHLGQNTSAAVHSKAGGSPVTDADILLDNFLRGRLLRAYPHAGWLSEERADTPERLSRSDVVIVDPIDGTRAFLKGDPRWTVCVALVRGGRPVAGVVHAPALDETYAACACGGAWLNGARLAVAAAPAVPRIAGPHFLLEAMRRHGLALDAQPKIPSLAYRMALVAAGAHDAGLTSGNAQDWDIAAADLIVREAGGVFCGLDGAAPVYNKADTAHPALIACAPALFAGIAAAAAQRD